MGDPRFDPFTGIGLQGAGQRPDTRSTLLPWTPWYLAQATSLPPAQPAPRASAFTVNEQGEVQDPRVTLALRPGLHRGAMDKVNGIIVHQTGGATAQSALDSYLKPGANGAHFLIDKDGTIYQTASVYQRTNHVGHLKARCLLDNSCPPTELKAHRAGTATGRLEAVKPFPKRFPGNSDSIGVEVVGRALQRAEPIPRGEEPLAYEPFSDAQQASWQWLLGKLSATLGVSLKEVYRHPEVSWKNPTEAQSARW